MVTPKVEVFLLFLICGVSLSAYAGATRRGGITQDPYTAQYETTSASTGTPIRLVGGTSSSEGRVEVFHDNRWGTVCDDSFNDGAAMVVCNMLGFPRTNAQPHGSAFYGQGNGTILLDNVICTGNENDINECSHNPWGNHDCGHHEDVGVNCSAPIRLVDGASALEGRLEVFHNNMWGTVCDDGFNDYAARVVCIMLGLPRNGAQSHGSAFYGQGNGTILLDEVRCTGNENDINECSHNPWGNHDCGHSEDVGVKCSGQTSIRLVDGASALEGRLEVFHKNRWGTVCDDDFTDYAARVVCNMLGFSRTDAQSHGSAFYGQGNGTILLDEVICTGNENDINECSHNPWGDHNCGHSEDVGVNCSVSVDPDIGDIDAQTPIRLVDGASALEGRLEVFHNNRWGTVCDDSFNDYAARVVCHMLGIPRTGAQSHGSAFYGQGNGTILLDEVRCTGNENDINECSHNPWGNHDCGHSEDVGVNCSAQALIRLVNGASALEGRLEVFHNNMWGTVCDDSFDARAARVVCNMLGFASTTAYARFNSYYGAGRGTILLDDVVCTGNETDIVDCRHRPWANHDCTHNEDVGVQCVPNTYYNSTWFPSSRRPYQYTTNGRPTWYQTTGKPYYYSTGAWYPTSRRPYYYTTGAWYPTSRRPYYLSTWYPTSRRQTPSECQTVWIQMKTDAILSLGVFKYKEAHYYSTGAWYPTSRRPYYYTTGGWYPTSRHQSSLEQAIHVRCDGYNGWDIRIDMNMMRTMFPNMRASHLYLGRNSCTGQNYGSYVMFRNSLGDCGSSQTTQGTYTIFRNELLYAVIDPSYSFIIRHYNWTMAIDCVVSQFGAYTAHKYVQHPHYYSTVSPQSLHTVGVQFYQDPNFMVEIPGNPLNVTAGTQVYVKVFTTDANWGEKMVVHDCYSEPASGSPTIRRYNLIRNGCEVDASTHIISQSTHETKFVFEEFEYALNKNGVYLYCDARFCTTSDYSQSCQQRCQSFG